MCTLWELEMTTFKKGKALVQDDINFCAACINQASSTHPDTNQTQESVDQLPLPGLHLLVLEFGVRIPSSAGTKQLGAIHKEPQSPPVLFTSKIRLENLRSISIVFR